jgi:AcrR family transcriptional regulator
VGPEQRGRERHERLLDAALELFARQGYANTSIGQLCAEARVTTRHFYQLFDSREAVLAALYQRIVDGLRAVMVEALIPPAASLDAQLIDAVHRIVHHYVADARLARIGVLEIVGVSPAMEHLRRSVFHELASAMETYTALLVKNGQLPEHNYHLICIAILGGVNELLCEWLTAPRPPDTRILIDEVTLLIRALLRGAAVVLD